MNPALRQLRTAGFLLATAPGVGRNGRGAFHVTGESEAIMSPALILTCIAGYFCFLLAIAWVTGRNANAQGYFLGNKRSPWMAVAFGLIGDSLSGVTFISVPGWVGTTQFSYLQMVLGYLVGYAVIAAILLPLFYRLNLVSIYSYLGDRFGLNSQKTGSFFFLLSRTIGAAFRLYLTASVIQMFVFDPWGIPFWMTTATIIALILAYTYRGGIKTLVWTDTFQSSLLLAGVLLSIAGILNQLDLGIADLWRTVSESRYSKVFFWDWRDQNFFWKQFLSGAFIAVVMTGLDQNMMQKNLSCRSLRAAQKNVLTFGFVAIVVNLFFLSLGALLYIYAESKGIAVPKKTDQLFPMLALQHLGSFAALAFIVGLTAATFSSADSVLTTLTTSFCIDFLGMDQKTHWDEALKTRLRHRVHIAFAVVLLLVILLFRLINNDAVISAIFTIAGYTYGPLLGLFAFGLFTRRAVRDAWVPLVCVAAPVLCYTLNHLSRVWLKGYQFGYELLILNGLLTFAGLYLIGDASNSHVQTCPRSDAGGSRRETSQSPTR
jgi:Na+/proline symporter